MTRETLHSARAAGTTLGVETCAPDAEALMTSVLRAGAGLAAEYPLVFGEGAPGRIVVLRDEAGVARSACAFLARDWHVADLRLRAGMIGSVATHAEWRGRGCASRVLAVAETALAADGCLFALLWADEPGFYERRGYRAFGSELDLVLDAELARRLPQPTDVRRMQASDGPHLQRLHAQHALRIERSEAEMTRLLALPGMDVLVREREGQPVAYACLGRGADLSGVVHEWAGAPADLLALVVAHGRGRGAATVVLLPQAATQHARVLQAAGLSGAAGVLGMGRLLDLARGKVLFDQRLEGGRSELDGDGLRVRGPRGELRLGPAELLGLLFPPRAEDGPRRALERASGARFRARPSPFAWGLDSI